MDLSLKKNKITIKIHVKFLLKNFAQKSEAAIWIRPSGLSPEFYWLNLDCHSLRTEIKTFFSLTTLLQKKMHFVCLFVTHLARLTLFLFSFSSVSFFSSFFFLFFPTWLEREEREGEKKVIKKLWRKKFGIFFYFWLFIRQLRAIDFFVIFISRCLFLT